MRDHLTKRKRVPAGHELVGVRELKTHAARILREVRDSGASYVLTHRGQAIGIILPLDEESKSPVLEESESSAWKNFMRAGQTLQRRFPPGVSGVKLLSAMRR